MKTFLGFLAGLLGGIFVGFFWSAITALTVPEVREMFENNAIE